MQSPHEVKKALDRISGFLIKTPVVTSDLLNKMLGHQIFFKVEALQHTGAFKVRGALNYLLSLPKLPERVVASTTGNNGIGVAFATNRLGIQSRVYMPKSAARVKVEKAALYGAEIIRTPHNSDAASFAKADGATGNWHHFPSSESEFVIAGAGTLCYEAIKQIPQTIDSIFASCATGGMLSGCILARNLAAKGTKVFGVEPKFACDASSSVIKGSLVRIEDDIPTIADGLRVASIASRTLEYIKMLDGFFLVEEPEIAYWTKVLMYFLQVQCEPACAINMAAVTKWLATQSSPKNVLVIISGGNIDCHASKTLYASDWIPCMPNKRDTSTTTFVNFAEHRLLTTSKSSALCSR